MHPSIDHINRYVSDVEKHIKFYRDVLNYELIDFGTKTSGMKYAIIKGNNHEMYISEKEGGIDRENTIRHIGYTVDNIDELLNKLKKDGYAEESRSIIVKTYSRQFYLKDPDGFEIDLIEWTDKTGFYKSLKKE